MLSGLKRIFLNMSNGSNGSLNAVCFNALTVHGGHLQIMFAALLGSLEGIMFAADIHLPWTTAKWGRCSSCSRNGQSMYLGSSSGASLEAVR